MNNLKCSKKLLAVLFISILILSSCSKTPTDIEEIENDDTENIPSSTAFPYTENLKADGVTQHIISDFLDRKGNSQGKLDEKSQEIPQQLENSNWYASPSITNYLSHAVKIDMTTIRNQEYEKRNARRRRRSFWGTDKSAPTQRYEFDEEAVMGDSVDAAESKSTIEFEDATEHSETPTDAKTADTPKHSTTNVQVEGVDEAEIIKTDGKFIYYLSRRSGISIVTGDSDPKRVATIVPGKEEYDYPLDYQNLYISGNNLIVISNCYSPSLLSEVSGYQSSQDKSTVVFIYDISSPEKTTLKRTVEISGQLNTTRLNNNRIYFVTEANYPTASISDSLVSVLPAYKDSVLGDDTYLLSPEDIHLLALKNRPYTTYSLLGSFDLNENIPVETKAYEGELRGVYMNQNALYLANGSTDYYHIGNEKEFHNSADSLDFRVLPESNTPESDTYLNRFVIDKKGISFDKMGIAHGTIINQYAMDEFQGTFRVATSYYQDSYGYANGITILDVPTMELKGELTGLAPREDLKSVRFTGSTAYVVTFQQTDPLFVIDLRNPTKPVIDGELEIPGFSTYLHPIGDNLLIGIGRDQDVFKDEYTGEETGFGRTYGVKVSMFDVSNPKRPVEIQSYPLGEQNADSEALSNPKSMMFDLEKNIMAFPLDYFNTEDNVPWNGGVVLSFSRDGFDLVSEVSLEGFYGDGSRFVYIGDLLFYLCENDLVVFDYNSYSFLNQIDLSINQ